MLSNQFDEYQTEIENLEPKVDIEIAIRIEQEGRFHNLVGRANAVLKTYKSKEVNREVNSRNNLDNVKLPVIEIPSFNGKLTKWRPFINSFNALIHCNNSLSNIQKFCYMKSALTGDALSIINSLETTVENYNIAYDLLNNRFDHKRRIIYSHANEIIHLNFKQLANIIDQYLRSLESLGINTQNWNAFLVPYVISKIDSRFIREWESFVTSKFKKNELPSCEELITFLLERSYSLDAPKEYQTNNNINYKQRPIKQSNSYFSSMKENCPYCKGEHKIVACKGFNALGVNERYNFVRENRLCINCLKLGHMLRDCKAVTCKECRMPHHVLLHFKKSVEKPENRVVSNCRTLKLNSMTLLSTAEIFVFDKEGNKHPTRALLDSG